MVEKDDLQRLRASIAKDLGIKSELDELREDLDQQGEGIKHLEEDMLETMRQLEQENEKLRSFERGWAKPHVWNMVAAVLRETWATVNIVEDDKETRLIQQHIIETLALRFAKRWQDEDGFEPTTFLNRCSPDEELYPFAELWEFPND